MKGGGESQKTDSDNGFVVLYIYEDYSVRSSLVCGFILVTLDGMYLCIVVRELSFSPSS